MTAPTPPPVETTGEQRDGQSADFVRRLLAYAAPDNPNRAALAGLRSAIGVSPGEAGGAHRYVLRAMDRVPEWDEARYYLVAGLFALAVQLNRERPHWPGSEDRVRRSNLGASFNLLKRKLQSEGMDPGAAEERTGRRFVALLNSHSDDLPTHLRGVVSLLASNGISIDFVQLLRDLRYWDHDDRFVQRDWARAFWGSFTPESDDNAASANEPGNDD